MSVMIRTLTIWGQCPITLEISVYVRSATYVGIPPWCKDIVLNFRHVQKILDKGQCEACVWIYGNSWQTPHRWRGVPWCEESVESYVLPLIFHVIPSVPYVRFSASWSCEPRSWFWESANPRHLPNSWGMYCTSAFVRFGVLYGASLLFLLI